MREDCDTCRHFGADFDHLPCSVCSGCSRWEAPTNADHIRSMTDEELATGIVDFLNSVLEHNGMQDEFSLAPNMREDALDWLKAPYKEGE